MQCPKCGHIRAANTSNPEWQCPECGIAYHKYRASVEQAKRVLRPLTAEQTRPKVMADGSVWTLIGANLIALVIALLQGWSLSELMLIYWVQSVIIGISYVSRIASLDKFSTENFRINNRAVEPTASTKRQTAIFFCVHYGFFHVGYLIFIFAKAPASMIADLGLVVCSVAFAVNHLFSYRYHRDLDRQGTPNIGTLMFTPYLRIVPMHLTIVLGASIGGSAGLLFFGVLKTAADAAMHVIEHRRIGYKSD
jgi:hypothetical protein